ncbi:MAG: hypothetical protein K5639_05355, partial [Eubacterium sp.]|nr:hypothetical protein [Eubacterium sp.]
MSKNAYFEIINNDDKMFIWVHPAEDDGEMFAIDEVITYLGSISFPDYDQVAISNYLDRGDFDEPLEISATPI